MQQPSDINKDIHLLKRSLWLLAVSVCLQAVGLVVIVLLVSRR